MCIHLRTLVHTIVFTVTLTSVKTTNYTNIGEEKNEDKSQLHNIKLKGFN